MSDYDDASVDELKILVKQFIKIKSEYGEENHPEIDERIKYLQDKLRGKEAK